MAIRFPFSATKAVGAMSYLLKQSGRLDKVKLMKLLYLADREHFLRHGRPITGDQQTAMKHGPLPSACLNLLDGEPIQGVDAFKTIHIEDHTVMLREDATSEPDLDDSERAVLDKVLDAYGSVETWDLVEQTHLFPEYRAHYNENTSTPIPYEAILKHQGDESHFRHNRPVVSAAMAEAVSPEFRADSDEDL